MAYSDAFEDPNGDGPHGILAPPVKREFKPRGTTFFKARNATL